VRDATLRLAERHRDGSDVSGTWQLELPGVASFTISVAGDRCAVSPGRATDADVVLTTDASTWLDVVDGHTSGIAAFLRGDLRVDGDLHRAVRLETLFTPAGPHQRLLRAERTRLGRVEVASLVAGSGTPVVLLHGLAANTLSFLPTLDALSAHHEVHALDLPGSGWSDKPLPTGRRYSAGWFAEHVRRYVLARRLGPVHVIGNSMGGRVAVELGLRDPALVRSVTGFGAAVAFDEYQPLRPLLRLFQSQWSGLAPLPLGEGLLERAVEQMFFDPGSVPPQNIRAAAADTAVMLRDRRWRLATMAAARHLGAEPATGRRSYWDRLATLSVPALFLHGRQDRLVPAHYAERVRAAVPHAQVEVWDALGHVPQFERPDEAHALVRRFLIRLDAPATVVPIR
jgi:pimeloyl-ACP methyl ester carboxylesterase